jgi:pyrroline-5-carboxylate reductase
MLDKRIAFIGSGAMAEAMISGSLRHKMARPENPYASDTRIERVEELHEKYGAYPRYE